MSYRRFKKPFVAKKGVDTDFPFKCSNPDKTPKNLTGYQFRTDLLYSAADTTPIATLTNGSGFTIDAVNGLVTMNITKETAALVSTANSKVDFPFANVYFDIEYNDGTRWKPFAVGVIRVMEQFTRSNDV